MRTKHLVPVVDINEHNRRMLEHANDVLYAWAVGVGVSLLAFLVGLAVIIVGIVKWAMT